jgi:hypothetical protein
VSQSVSHATLEYWAFGKEAAHSSEVASKRVTLGAVGYLGEVGLYAMDTCRAANSSIWCVSHRKNYDSRVQQTIGFTSTRVQRRKSGESSGCGDRERSLNDGQIPNTRAVRVHVSTGYNRAEGNRRASRNGRVSDLPRNRVTIRNCFIAKRSLKADVVCAPSPPPGGNGT